MPLELIAGLGTALVSFFMKSQANALSAVTSLAKLQMEKDSHSSGLADAAAKRSSPVARKLIAFFVLFVVLGGLLTVAFFPGVPVAVFQEVEPKSLLWGLFKWGKGIEVITANGLVLPPWLGWVVCQIIGFLFGTGAAKGAR